MFHPKNTLISVLGINGHIRGIDVAQVGHGACPCGALFLPIMGTLLAPDGHNCSQTSAQ